MDDDPETVSHGAEPRTDDTTQDDDPVGGCMHGLPLALPTLGPIAGGEPGRGDVLVKDPSVVLRAMGETAAPPALPFERSEGGGRRGGCGRWTVVGTFEWKSLPILMCFRVRACSIASPPPLRLATRVPHGGSFGVGSTSSVRACERACVRASQPAATASNLTHEHALGDVGLARGSVRLPPTKTQTQTQQG